MTDQDTTLPLSNDRFLAGLLEGAGIGPGTDDRELIDRAIGPATIWSPVVFDSEEDVDDYRRWVRRPPARWDRPSAELAADTTALDLARQRIEELAGRRAYVDPAVVRVMAYDPADALAIRALGRFDGLPIAAHVAEPSWEWSWRWPLRVAVVDGPNSDRYRWETTQTSHYGRLFETVVIPPEERVEAELLIADSTAPWDRIATRASAVIVLGDGTGLENVDRTDDILQSAMRLEPSAVIVNADPTLDWFRDLIHQLSHDFPLDAAAVLAKPDLVMMADPEFLARTALRALLLDLDDRVGPGSSLGDVARQAPFDSEDYGGTAGADATGDAASAGHSIEVRGGRAAAAAPSAPDPAEPQASAADPRRAEAEVRDGDGTVRKDGFVSGRYHSVTVRIARQPSDTAIVADEEFPVVSDVPVELVVDISVEGSRSRLPKRTLVLDPVDDTAWTEPVRFRAPTTRDRLRVFVVVLHEGRTVQSLTLAGPIVSADSDPGAPAMTLAVDQSSAASSMRDTIARAIIDDLSPAADPHREATARSIIVRPGLNGPVAYDPYNASNIPEQRLNRNQLAIRTLLTKAFDDPPDGLADAAGILVELAIQGVLLRNQLRRGADTFFEHDLWIHISSVGGSDLPLEIVYEHPMPRNDATVCRRALDGKIGCTPQCGDRDRDDRVCPFGFWATSKIIERRFHVDDRRRSDVSSQRTIRISEGAVVAISNRADNVDDSVSGRIGSAVQGFVDPAPCNVVSSWDEIVGLQQDSTRMLMLLVTHTIVPPDRDDPDLVTEGILDLPDDQLEMKRVDRRYVNPRGQEPGPVVLALGCDTGVLEIGLADFVTLIHDARAEVVLSAISPISGRSVASFAEELMTSLTELLGDGRPQRFGTAMTAARQRAITHGNLIGLALTTSGDADIQIVSV